MKIVKLIAENVKRLHAVEITPEGALVVIGGKNGAGKSSVLDSIAYAMGGERLVPSEPIRAGEAEAKVIVDLGDLVVTRKFKREKVIVPAQILSGQPGDVAPERETWGETTSTIVVTNAEGARYPSPQALLDRLHGRLTFDPLAFARDEPKKQDETLRKLVGLDFSVLNAKRAELTAGRTMLKRTHGVKESQLLAMPQHKDAPEVEIDLQAITQEFAQAEEYRKLAEEAEKVAAMTKSNGEQLERQRLRLVEEVNALKAQLQNKEDELTSSIADAMSNARELDAKQITAQAARAVVPDQAAIRQKLSDATLTNTKVQQNAKRKDALLEADAILTQVEATEAAIEQVDEEKQKQLAAATFPVPGLGLSDDGVTFNGLPFAQAGSAEQVRVSVAIGIALNPKLKVLFIRNGNLLDDDSVKAVAEQAKAADMQVWMEYVTADADGVSVMMEDGHAKG